MSCHRKSKLVFIYDQTNLTQGQVQVLGQTTALNYQFGEAEAEAKFSIYYSFPWGVCLPNWSYHCNSGSRKFYLSYYGTVNHFPDTCHHLHNLHSFFLQK